jgi:hypothetical protein
MTAGIAALICLTGAYVLLKNYNPKTEEAATEAASGEAVLTVDTADLTSVSFSIGGTERCFQNEDGTWSLEGDDAFPVDSSAVLDSLSGLTPLKAIRTLTDVSDLSEYGLDEPQNTITLVFFDGSTTTVTIGDENENTADDYVMLNEDSSIIYTADSALLDDLSSDLYDYALSDTLPDLLNNDVTGVSVTGNENAYELQKVSGSWMIQTENGTEDGDEDAITSLLSPLSALAYVDYLEHNCTDLSAYGLDDPQAVLTITYYDSDSSTEDESETEGASTSAVRTLTFTIGSTDSLGNYYVQMEGSTQVHTLSSTTVEAFLNCETDTLIAEEPESETEINTEAITEADSEA